MHHQGLHEDDMRVSPTWGGVEMDNCSYGYNIMEGMCQVWIGRFGFTRSSVLFSSDWCSNPSYRNMTG